MPGPFYGCFGTKLLKDGDGRVTGVIIRDAQNGNKYIQLNAAKGVILATGDNSGDEKIMKHFAPEVVEKQIMNMGAMGMLGVDVEGNSVETGDGLRMGAWIGAKVQDHHAPITHHMGSGMGITPFLQLNKRGERFMNECIPGQQLENQIELQPECTSFQLYDAKWGEQMPYMPANHGGLCYYHPEDEDESNPNYTGPSVHQDQRQGRGLPVQGRHAGRAADPVRLRGRGTGHRTGLHPALQRAGQGRLR
ncbi:MAG: FAD-binding protein [Faecalibacterium prausnitzii]